MLTEELNSVVWLLPIWVSGIVFMMVYNVGILLWETYCCAMAYPNYSPTDIYYHVVKLGIRPDILR